MNVYDFYITPDEYEIAKENGVSRQLLDLRIRTLAWEKEKAIQTPPHEKKSLKEWVEIAERNGICYSTLRYRINRLGWEPERAANQPLQDRAAIAKYASDRSRKYPTKYKRMAEQNGIPERTFYRRMKEGWDPQIAATRAPMTSSEIGLLTKEKRNFKRLFLKKKGVVVNG
ncbi:hypothetical protein J7E79_02845 [Bacillus sp. ISL-40]|uniref:hypothetical protein n=1 Tax=unclassified Bacillus (in: firmicutes) TaxID=185979 RepID=UPI001BE586EB|nr:MULTISPECIES: hypothetical protein [unclassified Bacillus (in: firmicutes)]MBT2696374.1 hypothetical protein [Bacillus sp. ISL-40]MBT2743222.1 hypothetical protein [Bacillus sp. ISL-77]